MKMGEFDKHDYEALKEAMRGESMWNCPCCGENINSRHECDYCKERKKQKKIAYKKVDEFLTKNKIREKFK